MKDNRFKIHGERINGKQCPYVGISSKLNRYKNGAQLKENFSCAHFGKGIKQASYFKNTEKMQGLPWRSM